VNLLIPILPTGSRRKLIVAVSGGADSVALLHLLLEAGYRNLIVAHFNHRLRGKASDGDAAFVEKLAAKLDLPCEIAEGDVRKLASSRKCSLETAAREARYSFLAAVAKKHRARMVVLAHHADDQVETLLLALSRGAGLPGLAAMPASFEREGVRLERPLLSVPGAELRAWLQFEGIDWVEDPTNQDVAFTRNRIRHQLLPALEAAFPQFRETFARSARHAAQALSRALRPRRRPQGSRQHEPRHQAGLLPALRGLPRGAHELAAAPLRQAHRLRVPLFTRTRTRSLT
jgi:tRNA(Ile)-lysidine synthase